MMAERRILHISDLHFSDEEDSESLLQKEKYVSDLMESLKKFESLDTLIISGDIVDRGGSQSAYDSAASFVQKMRDELKIEYVLCIPGNHDVSRSLLEGIKGDDGIHKNTLWEYYDVKLKYYWEFIKKCHLKQYQNSGLVSYEVLYSPNMILLGLDSTDQIGKADSCGFVNIESLTQALKDIFGNNKEKYADYLKIAILHHRPVIYKSASQSVADNNGADTGQYGTCDSENWEKVSKLLLEYNIHYILTGHVHGTQSGQVREFEAPNDKINYSTVGSIGVDFSKEIRDRLTLDEDKELLKKFEELICYDSLNGNHNSYNIWTFTDSGLVQEDQYKYIVDEGKRCWCHWKTKSFEEERKEQTEDEDIFGLELQEPSDPIEEEDYEEKILTCIRENELFRTGHYHWKNKARLNWIDTSYFFQHKDMMFCIAKGIDELFEKNEELQSVENIIGLGIKGAILLSYIRFLFPEKKCSYLPENKKEYNEYETALFKGSESMSSFVVLTDVVHSGRAVKSIIDNIYNKKFLNVKVVTIIDATPAETIAGEKGKYKVQLFSLARLKVIECHGGGKNCEIYLKKLANVVEYEEDKDENY